MSRVSPPIAIDSKCQTQQLLHANINIEVYLQLIRHLQGLPIQC